MRGKRIQIVILLSGMAGMALSCASRGKTTQDAVCDECRPEKTGLSGQEFDRYLDETMPAVLSRVEKVAELPNGFALKYPRDPELARALARYVANEAFC